jgi:TPR repeat protein
MDDCVRAGDDYAAIGRSARAEAWYGRAASRGNIDATFKLASVKQANYPNEAIKGYEYAAESGSKPAQYRMAQILLGTVPVYADKRDDAKAFAWFARAAVDGDARIQMELAQTILDRHPSEQKSAIAYPWAAMACEQKHEEACRLADRLKTTTTPARLEEVRREILSSVKPLPPHGGYGNPYVPHSSGKASDPCSPDLRFNPCSRLLDEVTMDEALEIGRQYDRKSMVMESRFWLEVAADHGSRPAIGELANLNLSVGNLPDAEKWLQKLAAQGNSKAMLRLGIIYRDQTSGLPVLEPVDTNPAKASWYVRQSSAMGNANAHYMAAIMLEPAKHGWRERQAMTILEKAARSGQPEAQALLGRLMLDAGKSTPEAYAWLSTAVANMSYAAYGPDHAETKRILHDLESGMSPDQTALGREKAYETRLKTPTLPSIYDRRLTF